jgi:hypothetical protein
MEVPEHIVWDTGWAVAAGMGFTVAVNVAAGPVHPFAVGVILYTTVAGDNKSPPSNCERDGGGVLRTCEMVDPFPSDAPVSPVCTIFHEKVVPITVPVREEDAVAPEQIVWVDGVAVA